MATSNLNVVVKLVDQLTGPAKQMAKAIADIEKMVSRSSNSNAFGGVVRGAQRAITQIDAIGKAAERASGRVQSLGAQLSVLGSATSMSGVTSGLRQIGNAVSTLTRQYQALHSQMSRTVAAPRMPPPPPGPRPVSTSGALATGAGVGISGYGAARGAGYVGTQAADLNKSAVKQELAGLSASERAKITQVSWEMTQKYKNFSTAMIQDAILEVRSVYGTTDQAIGGIEAALKSATVLRSQLKGKVNTERMVEEVFNMFKAADLRNVTDSPQETEAFINNMTKAITATGGRLTPRDFVQLLKYGKTGAQFWNDDFITRAAASIMQEGSASTVGTSLTSMYQAVISGRVGTKESKLWTQLGLVDPSKIVKNKIGDVKGIMPGGVTGGDIFRQNPYEWAQQVYGPALLKKLGYAPGTSLKGMSESDFDAFSQKAMPLVSGMFGNRNADWIVNTLLKYRPIERDRINTDKATGLEGASIIQNKDLFTAWDSFTTQMNNLLAALASPLVAPATQALNAIASAMSSLSSALAANPEVAAIASTAAGVAAGLIAIGAAIRTVSVALAISRFALGAGGVGAGTAAVAGAGTGGLLARYGGKLLRGAGWFGAALLGKEGLDMVDPGGNLWGLTNPIDRWTQDRFGFNLAGRTQRQLFPERYSGVPESGPIPSPGLSSGAVTASGNVSVAQKAAADLRALVGEANRIVSMPVGPEAVTALQGLQTRIQAAQALVSQARSGPQSAGSDVWLGIAQRASADLEFAMSSIKIKLESAGQAAGQGMMEKTAAGVAAGAPSVIAQAQAILAQIQSIFSTGITIPMKVSPSGVPSTGGVDPGVSKTIKSGASGSSTSTRTASVGNINVYAAPGMDPRQVAEAVDSRFREAVKGQLNDGVFA